MISWPTSIPGVVYRHYDRAGALLYIGSSNVHKFPSRQDDHAKTARWWLHVVRSLHLETGSPSLVGHPVTGSDLARVPMRRLLPCAVRVQD